MYVAVSHNITALKLDVESSLWLLLKFSVTRIYRLQAQAQIAYVEIRLSGQLNQATALERSQKFSEPTFMRDFQIKKYSTTSCGWAFRPHVAKRGQDAHPTRLDNLFVGNP
ncbi:hypothetical protein LC612_27160 [Nostoc sp. CHAB 5834]|nr:hypothetical protein [Nostoc sp. CHAB 5834]